MKRVFEWCAELFRCRALSVAMIFAFAGGAVLQTSPLFAQSSPSVESTTAFDIPAGPLAGALNKLAETAGVQFIYSSELAVGRRAAGVRGSLTVREAITQVLAGSGLTFRFIDERTVAIEKAPGADKRVLGPVKVEGVESAAVAGINGSTDPTATEGTGSYTSSALTVGSKMPLSMRETPQSVSVVTQQRIEDQNLTDVTAVLGQSTGITLVQSDSGRADVYSRGFIINNFRLDGGASFYNGGFGNWSLPDLAEYDHVEVLRGADSLFSGAGEPGGTVNLVRKRPLDHPQVKISAQTGSWNNNRAELDVSGPLRNDGRLRGRLVTAYEDRDYFYDITNTNKTLLYGVLEADLTPSTLLTAGGSMERRDLHGYWAAGLPRFENGADLRLPRDTCLCTDWSHWDFSTPELFLKLEQRLGKSWSAKLNLTRIRQSSHVRFAGATGAVDTATNHTSDFSVGADDYSSRQLLADLAVNGSFELFNRRHELAVGITRQNVKSSITVQLADSSGYPLADVYNYDPSLYPEPALVGTYRTPQNDQTQLGKYTTLRMQILDSLHFLAGFRTSSYEYTQAFDSGSRTHYRDSGVITPYYGLVYDVSKVWSLYASYTDIFLSQASYRKGPRPGGEPLEPVRGINFEVGAKASWLDGDLNASLAAYRIRRNNEAVSDPAYPYDPFDPGLADGNACCYLASAKVRSEGLEAELTGQIMPGWQMWAGYTFNQNSYETGYASKDGTNYHSQTPKHLFRMWTSTQLPGRLSRWNVGGGVNLQSANFKSGKVCVEKAVFVYQGVNYEYCARTAPYDFVAGFWAVFSARAEYRIDDKWSAALSLNNLTDRTYYQTVGDPNSGNWYGEPRNFLLTVHATF